MTEPADQEPQSPQEPPSYPPPFQPPPGAAQPMGDAPVADREADPQARMWGMFCHLAALAGFLTAFAHVVIPVGNILGPLVVWLIKKETYPFVNRQGKESLNFQITISICAIAASLLMFVAIGFVLLPAVIVFDIVMIIIASIKANAGENYRYPWSIRFIK